MEVILDFEWRTSRSTAEFDYVWASLCCKKIGVGVANHTWTFDW